MFGKTHSPDTLAKISEAQKNVDRTGKIHFMYNRIGKNNPIFGKNYSAETKALINIARIEINSSISKKSFCLF